MCLISIDRLRVVEKFGRVAKEGEVATPAKNLLLFFGVAFYALILLYALARLCQGADASASAGLSYLGFELDASSEGCVYRTVSAASGLPSPTNGENCHFPQMQ